VSVFETIPIYEDFDSMPKAIAKLLRHNADPAYLRAYPARIS
jgi:hypothetical protein